MKTSTNKPAKTLRDGNIKAVIWRNPSEKGDFDSVQIVRSFKDGDAWNDVNAFTGRDVLTAVHLLTRAYSAMAELRAKNAADQGAGQ